MADTQERLASVTTNDLFATFGKIGVLSFGGPAGQIALMHKVLVDEKKWLSEDRFLHALNFCMLLPGPEAMQLATYAGWLVRGTLGGLIAGLLFIVPGFLVIVALSALYMTLGDTPVVAGLLFGLSAAVLAIVLEAMIKVAKRALKTSFHYALAVLAFVAIAFLTLPFPLIIAAAALAGFLKHRVAGYDTTTAAATEAVPETHQPGTVLTIVTWGLVWLLPLAALWVIAGPGNVFADQAAFFSTAAVVTFGGAYAVLTYVGQQAVEVYGWLMPNEMVTGLGLAETTPGPLILVLVFVGFLGGARLSAFDPLTGGTAGAATALWFTFAPCFLWIFAGAPHMERLRHVQWISAALAAVTAAVVGVIANLAFWFALHVLFGTVEALTIGPLTIPQVAFSALNWSALIIAVCAAIALIRLQVNLFVVLGSAAAAGVLLSLVA